MPDILTREEGERIVANLRSRGVKDEDIAKVLQRQIVYRNGSLGRAVRAENRSEKNAVEQEMAGEMSNAEKAMSVGERVASGATFGLAPLVIDAAYANLDPNRSFADLRAEREDRARQLGALGTAADVVGGLATGGASLQAIKNLQNVGKVGKVALAAGDAALQGGVTGAAEGLKDATTEGFKQAGIRGGISALIAAPLGGAVGGVVGAVAGRNVAKKLAGEMAARGINVQEAEVIGNALHEMSPQKAQAALARINEFVRAGKGHLVTAADVLGDEGLGVLRATTNASDEAASMAGQRLRTRDADIVARSRKDLGEATGFTPAEMDATENAVLAERKAKADAAFGQSRAEGQAFDEANPAIHNPKETPAVPDDPFAFGIRDVSSAPPSVSDEVKAVIASTKDPRVASEFRRLISINPKKYANAGEADFAVQLKLYQRVNKRLRKLDANPNADSEEIGALLTAKDALGKSLEVRAPSFRPANAEYEDFSKALDAYRKGQKIAAQRYPSNARRIAGEVDPSRSRELNKGFVDRMAESFGEGPNPRLGAGATASKKVRTMSVGTENAREKIADRFGEATAQELEALASLENTMAKTSNAAQGNSTTAKQIRGLADLMNIAQDAGSSLSVNPKWFVAQFGRRLTTEAIKKSQNAAAKEAANVISDALTRGGEKEARSVIESLIAQMERQSAATAKSASVRQATRTATARASARND